MGYFPVLPGVACIAIDEDEGAVSAVPRLESHRKATGLTLPSSASSPQKIIAAAFSEFTIPSSVIPN
ncbi:MAG: hypothetical protein ABSH41_17535 [Syntrophobacteraceae bacterium]|jgi:hypothetical protein